MFTVFVLKTLLLLSILSSGKCGPDTEIYLFYDGDGRYHSGIVNHEENLRWFFGDGSQDGEKDIHFLLYARGSKDAEELIIGETDLLNKSKYNKTIPTKIIIHGFTNSDSIGFPPAAKQTFLDNPNSPLVNLIIVDWGKLARAPWYNQAARNTKLVGVKVARFIEFLVAQGSSLDQIHLIGHSLGSHVAGFVGSNLNNMTLSRITASSRSFCWRLYHFTFLVTKAPGDRRALDPALPLFGDASDENRIDPTDAAYVDVIHTAGGESSRINAINGGMLEGPRALAFIEPRGHADFFVNGGREQPGCGVDFFGACSHVRAYEYYLESVLNPKGFLSCECDSWEEFKHDICECPTVAYLGEVCASSSKGEYFLRTKSKPPYANSERGILRRKKNHGSR